jgi:hypothetical protein
MLVDGTMELVEAFSAGMILVTKQVLPPSLFVGRQKTTIPLTNTYSKQPSIRGGGSSLQN